MHVCNVTITIPLCCLSLLLIQTNHKAPITNRYTPFLGNRTIQHPAPLARTALPRTASKNSVHSLVLDSSDDESHITKRTYHVPFPAQSVVVSGGSQSKYISSDSQSVPNSPTSQTQLAGTIVASSSFRIPGFSLHLLLSYCLVLAKEIPGHVIVSVILTLLSNIAVRSLCTVDSASNLALAWCPNHVPANQEYLELGRNVVSLENTLRASLGSCARSAFPLNDNRVRNFASFDAGALPILELTSPTFHMHSRSDIKFWERWMNFHPKASHPPSMALEMLVDAGLCWPMAGSVGHLGVRLAADILIHNFTITHFRGASATVDSSSAPKDINLWGVVKIPEDLRSIVLPGTAPMPHSPVPSVLRKYIPPSWDIIPLGAFVYSISHDNMTQSFAVDPVLTRSNIKLGTVVLEIASNWGVPHFTCLYNFAVYGKIH